MAVEQLPDPSEVDVAIGSMKRRHLHGVQRIEQLVYPRPWSLGLFMSEIGIRDTRVYVVARVGGSVVGYGGLMLVLDDGHITTLAVDPAWHRHKIGTRVLATLADAAIDRGVAQLTLEVRASNEPAQGLYRAFGFAPAGIRKGYYVETNEDAIVMWAHDVNTPEYADRLARLRAGIPGGTILEDLDK
jgi:ribosomal-protein-alanine N-acetyltransferase